MPVFESWIRKALLAACPLDLIYSPIPLIKGFRSESLSYLGKVAQLVRDKPGFTQRWA